MDDDFLVEKRKLLMEKLTSGPPFEVVDLDACLKVLDWLLDSIVRHWSREPCPGVRRLVVEIDLFTDPVYFNALFGNFHELVKQMSFACTLSDDVLGAHSTQWHDFVGAYSTSWLFTENYAWNAPPSKY